MLRRGPLLLLWVGVLLLGCGDRPGARRSAGAGGAPGAGGCEPETWQRVARTLAVAVAYPDSLPHVVETDSEAYDVGGGFHRCIVLLADAVVELEAPPRPEVEEASMQVTSTIASDAVIRTEAELEEFFANPIPRLLRALFGLPHLGITVDDTTATTADPRLLRSHLRELQGAVYALRTGDTTAYRRTELHRRAAALWRVPRSVMVSAKVETLQRLAYELTEWYLLRVSSGLE